MNLDGNFPTYEKQEAIKSSVDAIKTTTDSTKTKVDSIDTKVGNLLNGRVVRSVQRGTVSMLNKKTDTVTISTIDPSKSYVLIDGGASVILGGSSSAQINAWLTSLTSNSLTLAVGGNGMDAAYLISWQVIEFY